jgi:hypothetical protein
MYLEEQASLCFTNKRLQTEQQQQQEKEQKVHETVDNGKKMGNSKDDAVATV